MTLRQGLLNCTNWGVGPVLPGKRLDAYAVGGFGPAKQQDVSSVFCHLILVKFPPSLKLASRYIYRACIQMNRRQTAREWLCYLFIADRLLMLTYGKSHGLFPEHIKINVLTPILVSSRNGS